MPKHFGDAVARIRLIDGVLAALRSSAEVASAAYFSAMPLEGKAGSNLRDVRSGRARTRRW